MTQEAAATNVVSDMQTATSADGTNIAYWRQGSGPPLLLVHGALSDRVAWILIQPILAERFTVYVMNRRGREGSGEPKAHAIEREFEDIVAVVDAIGEPVHLLGHSGGALCALGAVLLTDRLRSLTLYEPPPPGPRVDIELKSLREMIHGAEPEEIVLEFLRTGPRVPEEDIKRLRESPIWPHTVSLAPSLASELDAAAGYELDVSQYSTLNIPLLLLLGSDSPALLREVSDALVEVVPDVRMRVLEGQQHAANFDAPELFAEEVVRFLETVKETP
ncbi:MAG: alpha/beta hydrolase [Chloroflexi bacterium]|nr:alpha/beta hydrolase [Chloroflexota bacterium]